MQHNMKLTSLWAEKVSLTGPYGQR